MNAVVQIEQANLPAPVARRGISEAAWRTAMTSLFPGAKAESVIMVFDYCQARKLDPLKKPCHLVPMRVKNQDGDYVWRDVVMPGIYEYRTTATRTGLYMGHSKPAYGPIIEHMGRMVPEYCELTVYRWNTEAKEKSEYPVQLYFEEVCATRYDKDSKKHVLNERWTKAPRQMLTKCTEAAALREAFPDELGGTHTADEMDGQDLGSVVDVTPSTRTDPRGDISNVDFELVNKYVNDIKEILDADKEEHEIAAMLREVDSHLSTMDAIYISVFDKLAREKIISKANYRKYLNILPPGEDHGPRR